MSDQSPTPAEELRELIREAHGLMKDLKAERREITALLDDIPAKVNTRIAEALTVGLDELGKQTRKAMDTSVAKVGREFERLEAIFTGTDRASRRNGKPPLEDLIRQARAVEEDERG